MCVCVCTHRWRFASSLYRRGWKRLSLRRKQSELHWKSECDTQTHTHTHARTHTGESPVCMLCKADCNTLTDTYTLTDKHTQTHAHTHSQTHTRARTRTRCVSIPTCTPCAPPPPPMHTHTHTDKHTRACLISTAFVYLRCEHVTRACCTSCVCVGLGLSFSPQLIQPVTYIAPCTCNGCLCWYLCV